jgi:hypothetical protein
MNFPPPHDGSCAGDLDGAHAQSVNVRLGREDRTSWRIEVRVRHQALMLWFKFAIENDLLVRRSITRELCGTAG